MVYRVKLYKNVYQDRYCIAGICCVRMFLWYPAKISHYTVLATDNVKMKYVRMRLVAKLKHVCIHHAQVMVGT